MYIATVLKSGGDFTPEYVQRIANSIPKEYEFVCLSDDPSVPGYIPLERGYRKWWSKMELFRPDILKDDIFYVDLDTIITGDISEELEYFSQLGSYLMLSDFYFPDRLASGVMFIPPYLRRMVWNAWLDGSPNKIMNSYRGDQDFLGELLNPYARRFDEIYPDLICSYKAHIAKSHPKHIVPYDVDTSQSKIICFHGKPRPKDVGWSISLK